MPKRGTWQAILLQRNRSPFGWEDGRKIQKNIPRWAYSYGIASFVGEQIFDPLVLTEKDLLVELRNGLGNLAFFLNRFFGAVPWAERKKVQSGVSAMADNERQIAALIEAVQNLAVKGEQIAGSLIKLEGLFVEMLQKQEQDRAENRERMRKFDEEQEEFRKRQKKWDKQLNFPWVGQLAYLFFAAGFAGLVIVVGILATR